MADQQLDSDESLRPGQSLVGSPWTAYDALPNAALVVGEGGVVRYANRAIVEAIGRPANEIEGAPLGRCLGALPKPELTKMLEGEPGTSGACECIVRSVRRSGYPAELSWTRSTFDADTVAVLLVSERSSGQILRRRLSEAEQRLEAHLERTPLASIEWTLDRRARRWNDAAERIFGYTHAEVANTDAFSLLVHPESKKQVDAMWESLLQRLGGEASTNTNVTKDGRTILCRWYHSPLLDDGGRVVGVCSLSENVTEHELAERELRASQKRLASVVRQLPVMVWAMDERLVPVFWNEHAERVTGFRADEMIGNPQALELLFPDESDREAYRREWAELGYGDYDNIERATATADSGSRRISWSNLAARCPIPGWRAWGLGIDVTDQYNARLALAESERRFRDVLESVDLAGVIFDREGVITYCNDYLVRLSGWSYSEIIGSQWVERFVTPERRGVVREEIKQAIDGGPLRSRSEGEILTSNTGRRLMVWSRSVLRDAVGRIIGATALGLDVTDQRRAEQELNAYRQELERIVEERTAELAESHRQLAAAERLAGLGELAAGLGHDIGNVLLPIRCHLDALDASTSREGPSRAAEAIRVGLEHLDRLADGLRLLARSPQSEPARVTPLRIDDWWARVSPLIRRSVREGISFQARIAAGLPPIQIADHHLAQSVLNLVLNASEAIGPGASEGEIVLYATADPEDMVTISVEDNGPGMPPEVRNRALEPFFTTKSRGISTGMGLAVVHGIATRANGALEIESQVGRGTTMRLRLPIYRDQTTQTESSDSPIAVVLLKDPRLSAFHVEILQSLGYYVHTGKVLDLCELVVAHEGYAAGEVEGKQTHRGARPTVIEVGTAETESQREGVISVTPTATVQELRAVYLAVREEREA